MTTDYDEMWTEVEAHYRQTNLRFNFKPKPSDIKFLYDELLKFRKTCIELEEKKKNALIEGFQGGKK